MSYQVIARKYRPQVFDDVIGQATVTDTLKNAIRHDRVAHGYIFSGARGVGKTSTARILAKALNCVKGPTVTPCGVCGPCVEIAQAVEGRTLDVFEIDAASNRGIDEIRTLQNTVKYPPASRDYKFRVFIIDEAHMLTTEAFNSLLKTLEEPPPWAIFILATTEPHKLPQTIQSRCQHFAFRLLEYGEIVSQLERVAKAEKIRAGEGALGALAQAGQGSLRDALSLLDQVIAACGDQLDEDRVRQLLGVVPARVLKETVEAIHAGDSAAVLDRVAQLAAEGYELTHFCGEFTRFIRNLMIAKSCGASSALLQVSAEERRTLEELAPLFGEEDLTRFFQILLRTESELRYALEPRFHLELGLMKLVHASKLVSLETLLSQGSGAATPAASSPAARSAPGGSSMRASSAAAPSPAPVPTARKAPQERKPLAPPRPQPESRAPAPENGGSAPAASTPAPAQDARLEAIKSLVFSQSKFLGSCLDPVVGWRFENGEVRFLYARQDSWAADALASGEQKEKLRAACAEVLGQPVKICVTLQDREERSARPERLSARERARRDAAVEGFVKKFDCTWGDVRDLSRE